MGAYSRGAGGGVAIAMDADTCGAEADLTQGAHVDISGGTYSRGAETLESEVPAGQDHVLRVEYSLHWIRTNSSIQYKRTEKSAGWEVRVASLAPPPPTAKEQHITYPIWVSHSLIAFLTRQHICVIHSPRLVKRMLVIQRTQRLRTHQHLLHMKA